jgi:hypothetical protein
MGISNTKSEARESKEKKEYIPSSYLPVLQVMGYPRLVPVAAWTMRSMSFPKPRKMISDLETMSLWSFVHYLTNTLQMCLCLAEAVVPYYYCWRDDSSIRFVGRWKILLVPLQNHIRHHHYSAPTRPQGKRKNLSS